MREDGDIYMVVVIIGTGKRGILKWTDGIEKVLEGGDR